jgi:hypothetical protein
VASLLLGLILSAAPELPSEIVLKTPTESLSASHALALREGKIWWRSNAAPDAGWAPIPPDGLPGPTGRLAAIKELAMDFGADKDFDRPTAVTSITADGDNLLAVGDLGRAWYLKLSSLTWSDSWGPPGKRGPLKLDFAPKAVAMSHRRIPYADLDGNEHPVTAGVTTVYALTPDGRDLYYADPWLPPTWNRKICLPLHGTLIAQGLSASASTIFVIDGSGRSFTRLADFDTIGSDPALPYSWKREKREGVAGNVRTLPGEDWKEHPRPPGPATTRITILQTGTRNADRELRIEGEGQYWFKKLEDDAWQSKKTGGKPGALLVDALAETVGQSRSETLTGTGSGKGTAGVKFTLSDFDPDCSPAKLTLKKGDETVELWLHFHDTLFDLKKNVRELEGALLAPEGGLPRAFMTESVKAMLGGSDTHLEVKLNVDKAKVRLKAKSARPGAFSLELNRPKKAK